MARRNSPLVVFGNPSGEPLSERKAWNGVVQEAKAIQSLLMIGKVKRASDVAERLLEIARAMQAQLAEGVHANPRDGIKIGKHVQAIAYVHAKDNGKYVHGFGNAELNENELKGGILRLDDLKDKTDVEMIGSPDQRTITIRGTKGQPLHDLFAEV